MACAPEASPSTSAGAGAAAARAPSPPRVPPAAPRSAAATADALHASSGGGGGAVAGPLYTAAAYIDGQLVASTDAARYVAHKLWFPPAAIDGRFLVLGARAWR